MRSVSDVFYSFDFYGIINGLIGGGWFDILFPFLLVYAVILTILNKVEVLSGNKATRVIVAFVFALFSIAFPIGVQGRTLGEFLMVLFPGVTAFTMGILALYIVAAMIGIDLLDLLGKEANQQRTMRLILGGLGVLVVALYYARGFGWYGLDSGNAWLWYFFGDPLLWIIIVFGLLFYWISSEDNPTKKDERREERRERREA